MMGNALLAFGIVLTTATQLRLPCVPLGVGEICLVLWLGLILLRQLTGGSIFNAASLAPSRPFWALFVFAMSVGTCVALLSQEIDLDTMLHDAIAYLLVAAITCSIAATMEADRALRQTLWLLLAFWNIALVLQSWRVGASSACRRSIPGSGIGFEAGAKIPTSSPSTAQF